MDDEFELENDFPPPTPTEVAQRVIALWAISRTAQGEDLSEWISKHEVLKLFSDAERNFYGTTHQSERDKIQFSWRIECIPPLLWSLNLMESLPKLNEQVTESTIPRSLLDQIQNDPEGIISFASLRSDEELNQLESELYHSHSLVNSARIREVAIPENLDGGVVLERRYAMSWAMGYGRNWDEVPLDT